MDKQEHEVVEETTTAPAEENQEESTEQDEIVEESAPEQEVDHAAELAKLQAEKDLKKEHDRKFAEKRLKASGKIEEVDEEDRTSIHELVQKQVEEAKEVTRREVARYAVQDAIQRSSRSQAEADLAMYHFENTIRPTGNPREDAEIALLLANKNRYKQEMSEVARALKASDNKGKGQGAGQKAASKPKRNYSDKELRFMKQFNVDPDKMK